MDGRGLIGLFVIAYILLFVVARCDIAHAATPGDNPGKGQPPRVRGVLA